MLDMQDKEEGEEGKCTKSSGPPEEAAETTAEAAAHCVESAAKIRMKLLFFFEAAGM